MSGWCQVNRFYDIVEAARTYARAAKLGLEAANHAAEVKLRAERKAGELLQQLERAPGARTDIQPDSSLERGSEYRAVLTDSDIAQTTAQGGRVAATVGTQQRRTSGGKPVTACYKFRVFRRP